MNDKNVACTFSFLEFKLPLKRKRSDNSILTNSKQNLHTSNNSRINKLTVPGHNGRDQHEEATKYI
jgi:hypothetical protein